MAKQPQSITIRAGGSAALTLGRKRPAPVTTFNSDDGFLNSASTISSVVPVPGPPPPPKRPPLAQTVMTAPQTLPVKLFILSIVSKLCDITKD